MIGPFDYIVCLFQNFLFPFLRQYIFFIHADPGIRQKIYMLIFPVLILGFIPITLPAIMVIAEHRLFKQSDLFFF